MDKSNGYNIYFFKAPQSSGDLNWAAKKLMVHVFPVYILVSKNEEKKMERREKKAGNIFYFHTKH